MNSTTSEIVDFKIFLIDIGIKYKRFIKNRFVNRGLLSITTFLKKNGYEVEYFSFDQFYLRGIKSEVTIFEYIIDKIDENGYKVLAVSNLLIPETEAAINLIKHVKSKYPDIITIIGGYYFTFNDKEINKYGFIDYVVRGEGEWTLLDLIESIKNGSNQNDVKGITFINKHNQTKINEPRALGKLNRLPPLDYTILDKNYLQCKFPPNINLEFNRGCYYNCTFCSVSDFWNNQIRHHDIEKLVIELEQLKDLNYNGKISIEDSTLDLKSQRMKDFLDICLKITFPFDFDYITTRYDNIDSESLDMIYKLGFKDIILGLESASSQILNSINKEIDLEQFVSICKLINEQDVRTNIFVIVGLPGETKETFLHTYHFLKYLTENKLISNIFVSHFQPYSGIRATEDLQRIGGKIIVNRDQFRNWIYRNKPLVEYKNLDKNELQQMFDRIFDLNKINGTDFISRF